ncbi:MAG: putative baseplate assembly protein [Acidobacteria bacterium]|nr:putative baseplate assembly protein [Acidobacteriota bacterium]
MPIDANIPVIDDRRYDDIVAEARTRIARYTPEWSPVWTDVNDSDPGVTLVQLFAWLTEMLIFRLGRVPELNYLKFLQLIGIELNPAEPAAAEVSFPLLSNFANPYAVIPLHTQVSAEASDGGRPVLFETERAVYALTARLASVQSFDGFDFTDATAENDEPGEGFEPFGTLAAQDSAVLLGFDYAGDFPAQVELNLAFFLFEQGAGAAAPAFNCGLPESQVFASAALAWEYWDGKSWAAMSLLKDETRALAQSGHVYLKTPAKGSMQKAVVGEVTDSRYWIRGRLKSGSYERAPKLLAVRTNTVAVVQAETINDEVLGGSNGRPNQVFRLANAPVLAGTLRLEIDEGDGFHEWERVDDFFGSGPQDRHYVLNRTSGEVRFGDGASGGIPVGNVSNVGANVVAREYRTGGGKRGNVAAGKLTTLLTSIEGVDDSGIGNLLPAVGGRDEETLNEAKVRAPRTIKSRCRAVTSEDFETLALEAANIRRAKALPLSHPDFPGVRVPGVVTVVVVPDSDEPAPVPLEATLRTVCAYLNLRRLLTTELYVVRPTYREVSVRAEVVAKNTADLGEVKEGIEAKLLEYFHPLKGGEDGQGWPFGGNVFFSRVYQRVFSVPGVERISALFITVDGEEAPECKDVDVEDGILLFSTAHDIQVGYSFDE